MYEFIILSLLMRMPMHAYLIMKITNDQIGPWAKISSGTLSTMLNKLEQTGLIVPVSQNYGYTKGERRSRTFTITEEGRKRFHQLMMDTSSNLGDYQKVFYHKMSYFDLLRPDERLLLVNHYLNYCQITMLHVQTEMNNLVHELANYPAFLQNLLRMMKHVVQHWQAEYEWIKDIREQELEQAETIKDSRSNG
jgi:DNA-binding PadR family transcriptional regulator